MNLPIQVTQKELMDILLNVSIIRPVFIWGAPGIGKSALVEKFSEEVGLPCVSLLGSQLAPEDIIGIPQIKGETSEFLPPKMIARKVPYARVVFCDAQAYDAGYMSPEDIAGRVEVKGRGGTMIQLGIDLLENAKDFPKEGPILVITDGEIEDYLTLKREHAYLLPAGRRLPFRAKGEIFYIE